MYFNFSKEYEVVLSPGVLLTTCTCQKKKHLVIDSLIFWTTKYRNEPVTYKITFTETQTKDSRTMWINAFGGGVGWEGGMGHWVTSVAKNQAVALNLRSSLKWLLTATETVCHTPWGYCWNGALLLLLLIRHNYRPVMFGLLITNTRVRNCPDATVQLITLTESDTLMVDGGSYI